MCQIYLHDVRTRSDVSRPLRNCFLFVGVSSSKLTVRNFHNRFFSAAEVFRHTCSYDVYKTMRYLASPCFFIVQECVFAKDERYHRIHPVQDENNGEDNNQCWTRKPMPERKLVHTVNTLTPSTPHHITHSKGRKNGLFTLAAIFPSEEAKQRPTLDCLLLCAVYARFTRWNASAPNRTACFFSEK